MTFQRKPNQNPVQTSSSLSETIAKLRSELARMKEERVERKKK